jgi:outer membrane biosynthesis protein TonB
MYTTYPQHQNYGPQHNGYGYAPMQQPMQMQPMPMAAPVASSASKGLLMVAGLAVVGAAAFGGVMLMNSSQPEQTAASAPSTVFSIPSEINIPGLNTNSDPASPVIVNNPAPVRVVTPSVPRSNTAPVQAPAPVQAAPVQGQSPVVTKPEEKKPEETKPEEKKPEEKKPEEKKPEEKKPEEKKPEEKKPEEKKPEEKKPEEKTPGGGQMGGGAPEVDPLLDYGGCACG